MKIPVSEHLVAELRSRNLTDQVKNCKAMKYYLDHMRIYPDKISHRWVTRINGDCIFIAYSSESVPDKWWFGMPEPSAKKKLAKDKMEAAILLCGTLHNELIALELTPELINKKMVEIGKFGSGISKSGIDVKFNVRREGNGNYYLGCDVLA